MALKPRMEPTTGNYSSCTSSDSGDVPADAGSGYASAASSVSGSRPRLQLLPRGSSGLGASGGGAASAGSASASAPAADAPRKASVFGDARPREQVLRERGLDPAAVDAASELHRLQAAAGRGDERGGSRFGGGGEQEEEWHTVSGHGRRGVRRAEQREEGAMMIDPFFGEAVFTRALPVRQTPLVL
jgi:hypothetical protein